MAKFGGWNIDQAGFNAIKSQLTAQLADTIEEQLVLMGEDAKGISWFSSAAVDYANNQIPQAA